LPAPFAAGLLLRVFAAARVPPLERDALAVVFVVRFAPPLALARLIVFLDVVAI
jgi:hypothetical protein